MHYGLSYPLPFPRWVNECLTLYLCVVWCAAYGKVFLVRKRGGGDDLQLFAMKVVRKAALLQQPKDAEHTRTERQVLEVIRASPFLVTLHYAFQTDQKLHLILGTLLLLSLPPSLLHSFISFSAFFWISHFSEVFFGSFSEGWIFSALLNLGLVFKFTPKFWLLTGVCSKQYS